MDVIRTETTFEPSLGKARKDIERLIPIEDYAQKIGVSRSTVDRYAQTGRIETKKQHGQTFVVDRPLVEKDWFALGLVQAQAKAKTLWQIACLMFAALFVLAVLAGSVGGVRLWADRVASAEMLTATQIQVADAGKQITSMQEQLTAERRDHTTRLESQRVEYAARIDGLATAGTQLTRAAEQLKGLQAQLAAERQDHKAQLKSQQVSHAATVDQLHAGISKLASHVVELSKAVADLQTAP